MATYPANEQVKRIDERMSQLKAQRQAIINREKERERKDRTHRLIENGALAEKYLQCERLDKDSFAALLSLLVKSDGFPALLKKCKDGIPAERERLAVKKGGA